MKPIVKKADGTIVEMKDVLPGETVTLTIPRPQRPQPMGMMRAMAFGAEQPTPVPAEDIDLGNFKLTKAAHKTPEEVHAANTLTPEQLQARIAKWREDHPERSEQQLAAASAFRRDIGR